MKQVNKFTFPDNQFDLYFLAYDSPKAASHGNHWTDRQGIIELTHNYGTENDASYKPNNGNKDPGKGFGHVCISVDNIQAACQRLEDAGYKFQKKLKDGKMHHIAVSTPSTILEVATDCASSLSTRMTTGSKSSLKTTLKRPRMSRRPTSRLTA